MNGNNDPFRKATRARANTIVAWMRNTTSAITSAVRASADRERDASHGLATMMEKIIEHTTDTMITMTDIDTALDSEAEALRNTY